MAVTSHLNGLLTLHATHLRTLQSEDLEHQSLCSSLMTAPEQRAVQ